MNKSLPIMFKIHKSLPINQPILQARRQRGAMPPRFSFLPPRFFSCPRTEFFWEEEVAVFGRKKR